MSNQLFKGFDDLEEGESFHFDDKESVLKKSQSDRFSYSRPIAEDSKEYEISGKSSNNHSSLINEGSMRYSFHDSISEIGALKSSRRLSDKNSEASIINHLNESNLNISVYDDRLPDLKDSLSPKLITESKKSTRKKIFSVEEEKKDISLNHNPRRTKIFPDQEERLNENYRKKIASIKSSSKKSDSEKNEEFEIGIQKKPGIRLTLLEKESASELKIGPKITFTYGPEKIPGGVHYIGRENNSLEAEKGIRIQKKGLSIVSSKLPKNNISSLSSNLNINESGCCC